MNRLWLVFVLVLAFVLAGCVCDDCVVGRGGVATDAVAAPSPSASADGEDATLGQLKAEYLRAHRAYLAAKSRKALKSESVRKAALKSAALPPVAEKPKPLTVMTDRQKAFFNRRRIARSRDVTTIPGSVIVHYERNGKPDGVTTNVLYSVTGAAQNNAVQTELLTTQEELQATKEELQAVWSEYTTIYNEVCGENP